MQIINRKSIKTNKDLYIGTFIVYIISKSSKKVTGIMLFINIVNDHLHTCILIDKINTIKIHSNRLGLRAFNVTINKNIFGRKSEYTVETTNKKKSPWSVAKS
jgi:hypothetical protein